MKISTKGEYGLRALIELAKHYGEGYLQSSLIAARRDVPENYLYQLLITLRRAGIIRSRRGPHGGHMLARPPEQISMADAIVALEGPLAPVPCVQQDVIGDCSFVDECAIVGVWERVLEATQEILSSVSFADLVEEEQRILAEKQTVS